MILRLSRNKITKKSDEDLLREFRAGSDLEILGDLYSRYMHLVYGVSMKYLKDRDEAMDAAMQIFEKLITEIPKHKIENFRSWLHAVTKNYCLMQIRSKKSHDEKMGEWIKEELVFMENNMELHPIDDDESAMEKQLQECIEKLKEDQQKCIKMFYYEDRCYTEIAYSLGLDEKKVKSHLQNGKRNLKLCLDEKNDRKTEKY